MQGHEGPQGQKARKATQARKGYPGPLATPETTPRRADISVSPSLFLKKSSVSRRTQQRATPPGVLTIRDSFEPSPGSLPRCHGLKRMNFGLWVYPPDRSRGAGPRSPCG